MTSIVRVVAAACAIAFAGAASASDADAVWAAMKRCAAIVSDDARHACSDEVMRDAGMLPTPTREEKSADQRKRFGLPKPAPKSEPVGERVEVTLAGVEEGRDGKLVLTTSDGAVWRQVESDTVRPLPAQGQTMTVTKTMFGGFMCEASKRVAFRCLRAH